MIKIAICDTWGADVLHENYYKAFPNAVFIGHDLRDHEGAKPHPHGGMVASRLLLPLINKKTEVHFIKFLGSNGQGSLFDLLKEIKPDLVQCSWGQSRHPNENVDKAIAEQWKDWVKEEAALRKRLKYFLSFAAGNTDTMGIDYHDMGYPQRLLKNAVIAGAINRKGVVTDFSSDGNVTCVALGHYVFVLNPYKGVWEAASGTSFASPDTAGILLWLKEKKGISSFTKFKSWLKENATIPANYSVNKLPNSKFGWGGISDYFMAVTKAQNAYTIVNMPVVNKKTRLRWFDFASI